MNMNMNMNITIPMDINIYTRLFYKSDLIGFLLDS